MATPVKIEEELMRTDVCTVLGTGVNFLLSTDMQSADSEHVSSYTNPESMLAFLIGLI